MAFDTREKKNLRDSLADVTNSPGQVTEKISDAVAANGSAAEVAALGATENLNGVDGTEQNAAPLVATEARLDTIEAKMDELIAALKAQG